VQTCALPIWIQIVERNLQLSLFEDDSTPSELPETVQQPETWYLLYRRDGSKVFAELSLPILVGDDGVIKHWRERIILPAIDLTESPGWEGEDEGPSIDVDVQPRLG